MRRSLLTYLGVFFCLASLLVGCGGNSDDNSPNGENTGRGYEPPTRVQKQRPVKYAKTPEDAVVLMATAFSVPDWEQLEVVTKTDSGDKAALKEFITFVDAGLNFRDAFIREYGKAGWETFQDPKQGPKDGNAKLNLNVGEESIAKAKKADIKVNGDKATAQLPGEKKPLKLVREDGNWLVDLRGALPRSETRKMANLAKVIVKYQKAIGHKDISGEDIDAELGRAILKELRGIETGKPHRFEIDSIK